VPILDMQGAGKSGKQIERSGMTDIAGLKDRRVYLPKVWATFDPNKLARAIKQIEGSFAAFSDS
jgi:hypothetical protein